MVQIIQMIIEIMRVAKPTTDLEPADEFEIKI